MSDNFIENNKYNQLSFDTLQVLEMVAHIVVDKKIDSNTNPLTIKTIILSYCS